MTDFKLLGLGLVLRVKSLVSRLALVSSASPWQVSKAIKAFNYEYMNMNFGVNER